MSIHIQSVVNPDIVLSLLQPAIDHAYVTMYGDASEAGKGHPELFTLPRGRLWAAMTEQGTTVGIAGWTRMDELGYEVTPDHPVAKTVELKRLFVLPAFRGTGVTELLDAYRLHDIFTSGYTLAVGETGAPQQASRAVHSREPYRETKPFGDFHDNPGSYFFKVDVGGWFDYLQSKHISAKYHFGCDK